MVTMKGSLYCNNTLVNWYTGAMVHWCTSIMVQWYTGVLVKWCNGTLVYWYNGAMVHWYNGALVVFWCTGVLLVSMNRGESSQLGLECFLECVFTYHHDDKTK